MKLLTVFVTVLLFSVSVSAQLRWDGGGDGVSWSDAVNWEGDILPTTTDNVLLDNSLVPSFYEVILPPGAINVSVNSLTITPDAGENINLIVPTTNTASPALSVTGTGDALVLNNGALLINSTGAAAGGVGISITNTFRINNGGHYVHNNIRANMSIVSQLSTAVGTELGIFEYNVPSTAVYNIAGAGQTYGILILASDSSGSNASYRINTGAGTMTVNNDFRVNVGTSFSNATATNIIVNGNLAAQGGTSIDLSASNSSPVFSVYGNIISTGTISESGSGNPVIEMNGAGNATLSVLSAINGDNADFLINKTGTITLPSNLNVPGDFTIQSGTLNLAGVLTTLSVKGTITVAGAITETGTGSPTIELNGTTHQNINITGSITGDNLDFKLNNPAGASLQADLVLPYFFSIFSGSLTIGNYSLTTTFVNQAASAPIATNHIITNGTGFLVIPNVGAAEAFFTVGVDATSVNTVVISNGGGLTYHIRVEAGINPSIANPLLAVNRTWVINTTPVAAPATPANVVFYYYNGQGQSGFDYSAKVDVGQHTTGTWSIARSSISPTVNSGEYRVVTTLTSFNTPFIVGNKTAILPISFSIVCKGIKNNQAATISWKIADGENVTSFEIEKSVDNAAFLRIATVAPEIKKLEYNFDDTQLEAGSTLYRIKTILVDGTVRYSNTVAIISKVNKVLITSIAPNPVQSQTKITISAPVSMSMRFTLYDLQGRVLKQWQQSLAEGTNTINLQMSDFRAGIYFLGATDGSIKTNQMRIVKQ